jgi:DNA end-binding protein Ku
MARAIWKGKLIIGKQEVPVKMYSAVQDRKVHFRLLHGKDLSPIEQRIVRKSDGAEVPKEEQAKAFPLEDGNAVIVRKEELEEVEPPPSRDIDLCRFVPASLLGDQWYDRPYYLGPDDNEEAYSALVEALGRSGAVGIARWAMRKQRYVGALGLSGSHLTLTTLRRADQVLSVAGLDVPAARAPEERELKLAEQLVQAVAADFEPETWEDEYRERVHRLIESKLRGEKPKVVRLKPRKEGGSLSDQLQRSLEATRNAGRATQALKREKKVA